MFAPKDNDGYECFLMSLVIFYFITKASFISLHCKRLGIVRDWVFSLASKVLKIMTKIHNIILYSKIYFHFLRNEHITGHLRFHFKFTFKSFPRVQNIFHSLLHYGILQFLSTFVLELYSFCFPFTVAFSFSIFPSSFKHFPLSFLYAYGSKKKALSVSHLDPSETNMNEW